MILDVFEKGQKNYAIPYLKEIADFISSRDCTKIPDGEIEILERNLFVRVAEYETGRAEEKKFEAHTLHADLQFIASGSETMGYSLDEKPKPVTRYDAQADIQFFEPSSESSLFVTEGQFVVFFPGELHKPGCLVNGTPTKVKKLVFKIRMK
jgi:biofilm protein TabA